MKLFAVCAIAILPLVPCFAQWQLIDDFEHFENESVEFVATNPQREAALFSRSLINNDGSPRAICSILLAISLWNSVNGIEDLNLMDDFYYSPGENFSHPLFTYSGYTVDDKGNTNAEDWMGWLNLTQAPWLWSYTLNGWLYMERTGGRC